MTAAPESGPRVVEVTRRERDVLAELVHDGAGNREIAQRLGVSEDTAKTLTSRLMRRTGHTNRTALAVDLLRKRVVVRVVKIAGRPGEGT